MVKCLPTSAGITHPSIRDALVDLLGKPIAESGDFCVLTATHALGKPELEWRFISGQQPLTPMDAPLRKFPASPHLHVSPSSHAHGVSAIAGRGGVQPVDLPSGMNHQKQSELMLLTWRPQMDERRRQQIRSDIASLEADNSRAKETIRRRIAMMDGARPKDAQEHQTYIRNLEHFIKGNEQRISELKRELR